MKKPIAVILFCIATINLNTSLFAQSSRSAPNVSSIETMSLDQILAYLNNLSGNKKFGTLVKLTERLWDIAFFDHHVPIQKRRTAIKLLEPLIKDVEEGLKNNPDTLRLYREANKTKEYEISYFGLGSLQWKIEENNIPSDQVLKYIMTIEHAPLLNNYFELLGEKAKAKAMPDLISELIYSRQYKRVDNAVLILHGLAAKDDLAAQAVFSDKDFGSLMRASSDYKQARDVLVKFNLLPTQSDAKPLFPKPKDEILSVFIFGSSNFRKDIGKWEESSELIELENSLYGEQKDFISISVILMRIHLWLSTIRDIYGDDAFRNIKKKVFAQFTQAKKHGLETWFNVIALAENMKTRNTLKTDLDTATALALMDISGIFPNDKETYEKNKDFLTKLFRIINLERVYSLNRIRFYLRYLVGNYPEQSKETKGDVIDDVLKALLLGEKHTGYFSEDQIRIPRDYTSASQLPPKTSDTSLSALHQEKLEEIQGLRNKGDLTDAFQMESWTLLMYAVAKRKANTVNLLIERGVDVNVGSSITEETPLLLAAKVGDIEIFKMLLSKGANIEAKAFGGYTLLMGAAVGGNTEIMKILFAKGVQVNSKESTGKTALTFAALFGNTDAVTMLLDNGADIDAQDNVGWTALMIAAMEGKAGVIRTLVSRGADITAKTWDGMTAYKIAELNGRTEILHLLK